MIGLERNTEIVYPRRRQLLLEAKSGPLSFALYPASVMVSVLGKLSRNLNKRKQRAKCVHATVISIGNIEVGGTGKTPFAVFLAEKLLDKGYSPVYVSRGYRSVAERLRAVTVVPPDDHGISGDFYPMRWVRRDSKNLYFDIGDEGVLVSRRLPDVPLVFSRNKLSAIKLAEKLFSPTHIILDDAFQSWSVPRDIDIVLLDAVNPLADGRLIPSGRLREGAGALRRADLLCFIGVSGNPNVLPAGKTIEAYIDKKPCLTMSRRLSFPSYHAAGHLHVKPCAALSAIARPDSFEGEIKRLGVEIKLSLRYPDHYGYSQGDMDYIIRKIKDADLDTVITTEKDWVKLADLDFQFLNIVIARLDLVCIDSDLIFLLEKMKRPRC